MVPVEFSMVLPGRNRDVATVDIVECGDEETARFVLGAIGHEMRRSKIPGYVKAQIDGHVLSLNLRSRTVVEMTGECREVHGGAAESTQPHKMRIIDRDDGDVVLEGDKQ